MTGQTRAAPSRSVFIGNIPWDATEEQLRQICEEVGPIVSLRMVLDKETKKPKGFAFAEYLDEETAESARRNLHGYEIHGRLLRVGEPTGEKQADRKGHEARPPIDLPDPGPPLGASAAAAAASTMAAVLGGGQSAPGGVPAGDPLAGTMAGMGQQQLYQVLATMKAMIQQNPAQARQILMAKPDLTKSLFFAQISLGMVKPPPAAPADPTPPPAPTPPLPPGPRARPPHVIASQPPLPAVPPPQPPGPRPPPGPPPGPAPVATQWAPPTPPLPPGPPQGGVVRGPALPPGPPPAHAQPQPPQQLYPVAPAPLPPYPPQPVPQQAPQPPPLPPANPPLPTVGVAPPLPSQRPQTMHGGVGAVSLPPPPVPAQQLSQAGYTPVQQALPIPPNLPPNMVAIYTRLLSISEAEVNALPPDAQALARSIRQSARNQAKA